MSRRKRKLSRRGAKFIASFEGFRATPYRASPSEQYLTIGFGHYGSDVKPGMRWSRRKALRVLRLDAQDAADAVARLVKVPLTQARLDCLVSFVFNVGAGAFESSSLLRQLNSGHPHRVPAELRRWTKAGGVELEGLVRRREAEGRLWTEGYRR